MFIITEKTIEAITKCRDYYKNQLKAAETSLKRIEHHNIHGKLRVAYRKGKPQYYLVTDDTGPNGKYISKKDVKGMKMLKLIAQRDYDHRIISCAEKWIDWAEFALMDMPEHDLVNVYYDVLRRKDLIRHYHLTDDDFAERWMAEEYQTKAFYEDAPEIYAAAGHRVRSKSEKIIADKLYMMGVPYRYEYPLMLDNGRTIYPDFTVLNVRDRKEYYLEHFGMMDNDEYVKKTVMKLNSYAKSGIFPGDTLLLTFETSQVPLDIIALDELLVRYFG